uniref:Uncharacterized protein n=1 Tax=Triticum urartu TaxID=4572 RepID=A0A8R7QQH4_TRIUA
MRGRERRKERREKERGKRRGRCRGGRERVTGRSAPARRSHRPGGRGEGGAAVDGRGPLEGAWPASFAPRWSRDA